MAVWLLLAALAGAYAWSVWRLAGVGSPPRASEEDVTIRVAGCKHPMSDGDESDLARPEGTRPPGMGTLRVLHTTLRSVHGHRRAW
jgi:hypothetical protein